MSALPAWSTATPHVTMCWLNWLAASGVQHRWCEK
jgi:hypothetical protein